MIRIKELVAAVILVNAVTVSAQDFETGFFLDNYLCGYRINPAFQNDVNIVSALLGNVTLGISGDPGLGNYLFPISGGIVSGFDDRVPASKFISGLKPWNSVLEDLNVGLVTVGFWNKGRTAYNTVEINVRENVWANAPKDLLALLKDDYQTDDEYDLSNTAYNMSVFVEMAYGYSRSISDRLKVGGRLKLLLGLLNGNLDGNNTQVKVIGNESYVTSDATFRMGSNIVSVGTTDGNLDLRKIDFGSPTLEVSGIGAALGISGVGAALDLGVTFEPIEGLVASLAINDLGGLGWKYNLTGKSSGQADEQHLLESEGDSIYEFIPTGEDSEFQMLGFSINGGVRYTMPFYSGLSAGIFGTYRNGMVSYCNFRLGATITPVKWFSFNANMGYGTFGPNFGAAFNITSGVFNLYAGLESYIGRMKETFITPLNPSRICPTFGIIFRFGGKKTIRPVGNPAFE